MILLLFWFCLEFSYCYAAPYPESVVEVRYGEGAGFGQDYFPDNVLGAPDPHATRNSPSADPREILTLGSAGSIVLSFADFPIVDDIGVDFTIFENAFYYGNQQIFAETGIVAVSEDGLIWHEFPYNPISLEGLAGKTPTNGAADPLDPEVSGGDSFDLSLLDLVFSRYVRITDSDQLVSDSGPSFDLDAVAAIHWQHEQAVDQTILSPKSIKIEIYPNPFNSYITIKLNPTDTIEILQIYNLSGQLLMSLPIPGAIFTLDASNWSTGSYIIALTNDKIMVGLRRIVLLR